MQRRKHSNEELISKDKKPVRSNFIELKFYLNELDLEKRMIFSGRRKLENPLLASVL